MKESIQVEFIGGKHKGAIGYIYDPGPNGTIHVTLDGDILVHTVGYDGNLIADIETVCNIKQPPFRNDPIWAMAGDRVTNGTREGTIVWVYYDKAIVELDGYTYLTYTVDKIKPVGKLFRIRNGYIYFTDESGTVKMEPIVNLPTTVSTSSIAHVMIKPESDEDDDVKRPKHYIKNGKECIDWIREFLSEEEFKGYLKGNILKYLWRHPEKGDPQKDLAKAGTYLEMLSESSRKNNAS